MSPPEEAAEERNAVFQIVAIEKERRRDKHCGMDAESDSRRQQLGHPAGDRYPRQSKGGRADRNAKHKRHPQEAPADLRKTAFDHML